MNGEAALPQQLFNCRGEPRVINGAQRLREALRAHGDGRIEVRVEGAAEQKAERGGVGAGHVAGKHETPFGQPGTEGGIDAAQRPEAREALVEAWNSQMPVYCGGPHEEGSPRSFGGLRCHVGGQRPSPVIEHRLVGAHPAAPAAGEDEGGARHERIVAAGPRAAAGCGKTGDCV